MVFLTKITQISNKKLTIPLIWSFSRSKNMLCLTTHPQTGNSSYFSFWSHYPQIFPLSKLIKLADGAVPWFVDRALCFWTEVRSETKISRCVWSPWAPLLSDRISFIISWSCLDKTLRDSRLRSLRILQSPEEWLPRKGWEKWWRRATGRRSCRDRQSSSHNLFLHIAYNHRSSQSCYKRS